MDIENHGCVRYVLETLRKGWIIAGEDGNPAVHVRLPKSLCNLKCASEFFLGIPDE